MSNQYIRPLSIAILPNFCNIFLSRVGREALAWRLNRYYRPTPTADTHTQVSPGCERTFGHLFAPVVGVPLPRLRTVTQSINHSPTAARAVGGEGADRVHQEPGAAVYARLSLVYCVEGGSRSDRPRTTPVESRPARVARASVYSDALFPGGGRYVGDPRARVVARRYRTGVSNNRSSSHRL